MIASPVKRPLPIVTKPMPSPQPTTSPVKVAAVGLGQARARVLVDHLRTHAVIVAR
jgi:hypothetical protein